MLVEQKVECVGRCRKGSGAGERIVPSRSTRSGQRLGRRIELGIAPLRREVVCLVKLTVRGRSGWKSGEKWSRRKRASIGEIFAQVDESVGSVLLGAIPFEPKLTPLSLWKLS